MKKRRTQNEKRQLARESLTEKRTFQYMYLGKPSDFVLTKKDCASWVAYCKYLGGVPTKVEWTKFMKDNNIN